MPKYRLNVQVVEGREVVSLQLTPEREVRPSTVHVFQRSGSLRPLPFVVETPRITPIVQALRVLVMRFQGARSFYRLNGAPIVVTVLRNAVTNAVCSVQGVARHVVFRRSASAVLFLERATRGNVVVH